MITFSKPDDVFLSFEGDRGDIQMLSDYFTFEVPNAKFDPRVKNKFWDGKIRLANLKDMTIPAGLALEIVKFARLTDTDIKFNIPVEDLPCSDKPVPDDILEDFLADLEPYDGETRLVLDDYQREAIKFGIKKERTILLAPTSSGKSLIAYFLLQWFLGIQNRRVMIIVPTVGLVTQLEKNFKEYSQYAFDDICTSIKGQHLTSHARTVITTWQSVVNLPADWFQQFGAVIVDEVHHAEAKSIQHIMRQLKQCPFRIGMSGSLKDAKTHQMVLIGAFGPIKQVTTMKELAERGRVAKLEIRMMHMEYPKEVRKDLRLAISRAREKEQNAYPLEIAVIKEHAARNHFVCKLAVGAPGCTLVTFKDLDHGQHLYETILSMTDRKVVYVAGETDVSAREAARQLAEAEDIILVASLGVFSTGVNIKKLHNLVFAHPTKSKTKVLQSIGRILRLSPDGRMSIMYDIVDDLRDGSFENYAWQHAVERLQYYLSESHNYRTFKIPL